MAEGERNAAKPFFEQKSADADFEYWGKAAYWTLDEAVALSFGKSPEIVNWTLLEPLVGSSQFAEDYGCRRELTIRAKTQGQLVDPVLPRSFLAWTKQLAISVPADLQAAVDLTQTSVTDWKARYESLEASFDEQKTRWVSSLQDKDQEIQGLCSELGEMQRQLKEATQAGLTTNERRANTRERGSLLRIIIGLAAAIYCYDPDVKKDDVAPQIQGDLDLVGLKMIHPAILELVALGFVEVTEPGRAGNAEWRRPAKYRLTYRHTEDGPPTKEWKRVTSHGEAVAAAKKARSKN